MSSKKKSYNNIGVIGAGKFGTAVANLLAHNATTVWLYTHKKEKAILIKENRIAANQHLSHNIHITNDLSALATNCAIIFPIIPALHFRAMMRLIAPYLTKAHLLIHGTKGFDVAWPLNNTKLSRANVRTMSEVIQEESNVQEVGCLGGPNLVSELAQGQPAATVVASTSDNIILHGKNLLKNRYFQVYHSKDLLGVELCGSLKNIFAVGAGIISGMGYGDNTKALLISRSIVEMVYIGQALGATKQPFIGLAGVGDLIATCANSTSRNYTIGYRIAKGESLAEIMHTTQEVAEGIHTVRTIYHLVSSLHLRAPITEIIYRILFEHLALPKAIQYLMQYPLDADVDFLK